MFGGEAQVLVLPREALDRLFDELAALGFRLIGPRVQAGALAYSELTGAADLPLGIGDEHAPGRYRLHERGDQELFGYAAPLTGLRRFFQAPEEKLYRITRKGASSVPVVDERPLAAIGVRACDLSAVAIQDRVLHEGAHPDARYAARRSGAFVIAVACTRPGGTCFCASMDAGPEPRAGYDLSLTELADEGGHRFVVRAGSERGRELLARLGLAGADDVALARERELLETARASMGRHVDAALARRVLAERPEHPRWDDVASRCLSCANCTLLCPTCFCSSTEDRLDVDGDGAERWVHWDSCFNEGHSYVHGGPVRPNTRARYRQWLTHKFSTWHDQFGTAGCVGCGRCISGCPAAIDVTEEIAAIAAEPLRESP
jgi:sulfhydrogenase subunit beta (sulfur reductase)